MPAAAHLASVAPQPNSMSSGWARDGQRPVGRRQVDRDRQRRSVTTAVATAPVGRTTARSSDRCRRGAPGRPGRRGGRRPSRGAGPCTTRAGRPRRAASVAVAAERPGAVGEPEPAVGGHGQHVGAVVAPVGHERHAGEVGQPVEPGGEREVGVGDDRAVDAVARSAATPSDTAPLSPRPGHHTTRGARALGPRPHLVVVAHHDRGQRIGGQQHDRRPCAGPGRPARRGSSALASRTLAWSKALTGTTTAADVVTHRSDRASRSVPPARPAP